VIRYKQEAFMKKYIEKNAKLRAESKTDFEKYLFKLMNNAKKALKKIRSPLFQSIDVINKKEHKFVS
jgi:hypothetical protein